MRKNRNARFVKVFSVGVLVWIFIFCSTGCSLNARLERTDDHSSFDIDLDLNDFERKFLESIIENFRINIGDVVTIEPKDEDDNDETNDSEDSSSETQEILHLAISLFEVFEKIIDDAK